MNRVDDLIEIDGGRAVTWTSEKDGWRHLYRVALDGSGDRLLTKFEGDVIDVDTIDAKSGWAYFSASPDSAIERVLYRARLDGSGAIERVTPAAQRGLAHLSDLARTDAGRSIPPHAPRRQPASNWSACRITAPCGAGRQRPARREDCAAGRAAGRVLHARHRRRRDARRVARSSRAASIRRENIRSSSMSTASRRRRPSSIAGAETGTSFTARWPTKAT